jgi:hypothetical protein
MLAFALSVVTAKDTFVNSPHYAIWCVGNCDTDVKTVSYPGAVLMGGSVSRFVKVYTTNLMK